MNAPVKQYGLKQQQGYGLLQWILILLIASFFLLIGFRTIPLYTENQFVVTGLKSLVKVDENFIGNDGWRNSKTHGKFLHGE